MRWREAPAAWLAFACWCRLAPEQCLLLLPFLGRRRRRRESEKVQRNAAAAAEAAEAVAAAGEAAEGGAGGGLRGAAGPAPSSPPSKVVSTVEALALAQFRPPNPELSTLALTTGSILMLEVHSSLSAYICKKLADPATAHLR